MLRLSQLFNHTALYFIGNVMRRAVGFLMIPLYTHYLTPADYGVIELVELFVSVACISSGIAALSDSMVRIYYDYSEAAPRRNVVGTAILSVGVVSLLLAAAAFPLAGWISALVFNSPDYAALIRVAFAAMFFSNVTEVALVYQRMRQRAVFFVVFSLVQLAFNLALNVYFIAFARMGAWGFVLSKAIYASLGGAVVLAIVCRETGLRFKPEQARRIAYFGWPLVLTSVSFFIIHFADRFFLSHWAGLAEVGVYALAYKFAFLVTTLVGEPFGSVWNTTFYQHVSASQWRSEFARVARYLMFFLVFAAVGISVFVDKVLALTAAPAFLGAVWLVPVLAAGYAFRELGDFFRNLLFINKRAIAFSRIAISCAVLNIALNCWLIPRFHEGGAAWATLVTWVAYLAICWSTAQAEHCLPSLLRPFTALCGMAGLTFAGAVLTANIAPAWQWPCDAALVGFFVALAWSGGYFSPSERESIRDYLGRYRLVALAARWR